MTVPSEANPVQSWDGDDVTVAFSISTYSFLAVTDITVARTDTDGTSTTLTKDAAGEDGYTLSGTTITMNTAPATGEELVATRDTTRTQLLDLVNNRSSNPDNLETALDRLTYITQENNYNSVSQAVRADSSVTDTPDLTFAGTAAYRADRYIGFDSSGDIALLAALAGSALLDEDNMASDSNTQGATQQSIKAYADAITAAMTARYPAGMICLWSGAISDIPAGFALCDGSNGTPPLTDRFILHADADTGGTNDVGDTGTGAGTSEDYTLEIGDIPNHSHSTPGNIGTGSGISSGADFAGNASLTSGASGGGGAHAHGINNANYKPKYYALAYIMKL